ncbi:NAD-dependent epimerase/dehydratase family protein [Hoeflea prorocentri]|uniref:NAD(P)-dependent oxidoreductase n=1 Tax=Hoeflea prorocentri TaxID=1922333 RepID=A0A9X3ZGM0_9HYPH|nr:NAD(P)-dependent oxidoreductase [Hoeflea prorocentri]MCY6379936.1 NAD(P)-dependent oxidoreductase [Hoeflea prorocentri]MDA5397736.1 NAD(P)-dependent oxidoreductase [Hoeflea prorocentri]
MTILVTGSAGHLGEALVRTLQTRGHKVTGLDIKASPFTTLVGSIADRSFVSSAMQDVDAVIHAATLHKPHVATHGRQDFIDTNITGTLNLLEEAAASATRRFVFTSTTSVFGMAMSPAAGEPAAWITEDVVPVPKNIYGITKLAAENLCRLIATKHDLPVAVLRTSRFFPEADDRSEIRNGFEDENAKANEFLFRRVDIEDAVEAHLLALEKPPQAGFGTYIVSTTTPFRKEDLADLRTDPNAVFRRRLPDLAAQYEQRGWSMFADIDRVYVNEKARSELGWQPRYDYRHLFERLKAGEPVLGPMAQTLGLKGYHSQIFDEGPYPVDH